MFVSKSDVNRKIGEGSRLSHGEKSSLLHQYMSTGESQKLAVRERSHYGCQSCNDKDWDACPARGRTGTTRIVTTVAANRRANPAHTRLQQSRAEAVANSDLVGKFIAMECDGTVHVPTDPAAFNVDAYGFFATDPFLLGVCTEVGVCEEASEGPYGKFKAGDKVLHVDLWRSLNPGSLNFRLLEGGHHHTLVFVEDCIKVVPEEDYTEVIPRPTRNANANGPTRSITRAVKGSLLVLVEGVDHAAQRA